MKIVIKGNPITKKNSMRLVNVRGRVMPIPSVQYKAYEKSFIAQCIDNKMFNKNISTTLNIACVYFMQTKRKVDLTNLLSATMDCLVSAKTIQDDNCSIAYSHDGSYVCYDKNNPRVEITFTELGGTNE